MSYSVPGIFNVLDFGMLPNSNSGSRVFHTREDALRLRADMDVDWSPDFLCDKS